MTVNSNKDNWTCSCGVINTDNFCGNCGSEKPVWNCICGNINTNKFCTKCGNNKDAKVGESIKFGRYPQTANGEYQSIEWLILAIEENKMLLISKCGLEVRCFDSSSNNWSNSEIRQWLNDEFYNEAFDDQEKISINLSNLSDVGTSDNIFFLSRKEVEEYCVNDDTRKCKETDYTKKKGALVDDNDCRSWWLRSFTYKSDFPCVYCVDLNGSISYDNVLKNNNLVRPALWIKL